MERLKAGLRKTGFSIATVFTGTRIDDALYEDLEAALLMADAGVNATQYLLDDLKGRVKAAKATTDIAERTRLYKEAQQIIKQQVPMTPIAHSTVYQPMRKNVEDFKISPFGLNSFYGVSITK